MFRTAGCFLTAFLLAALFPLTAAAQGTPRDIDAVNDALGIGVNLGNALEAPREGEWGVTLRAEYFELIADAGFAHVRVPIKFSAYADETAPYTIPEADPTVVNASSLWERVDWVIAQAEANGLYVILDLHHYDELHDDRQRIVTGSSLSGTRLRLAMPTPARSCSSNYSTSRTPRSTPTANC